MTARRSVKAKAKAAAKKKARAHRVSTRVRQIKAANKYRAELARERRQRSNLVRRLGSEGYTYPEIVEELRDEGYDDEDINEAIVDQGYTWRETLIDAIRDQLIDLKDAGYYADLLGITISEVYDIYWDSPP